MYVIKVNLLILGFLHIGQLVFHLRSVFTNVSYIFKLHLNHIPLFLGIQKFIFVIFEEIKKIFTLVVWLEEPSQLVKSL